VTVAVGSHQRVNQANDGALIAFRQRRHALKSFPKPPLLWVLLIELRRFRAERAANRFREITWSNKPFASMVIFSRPR
jgi:hypothetical protein